MKAYYIIVSFGIEYLTLYSKKFRFKEEPEQYTDLSKHLNITYFAPIYMMIMMASIDKDIADEERLAIEHVFKQLYQSEKLDVLKDIYVKQIREPLKFSEFIANIDEKMKILLYKVAYTVALIDNLFKNEEIELLHNMKNSLKLDCEQLNAVEEEIFNELREG